MLDLNQFSQMIIGQLRASGIHEERGYLGMSAIGRCPLDLYRKWFEPDHSDRIVQYGYTGYLHESDLKRRLVMLHVAAIVTEAAGIDERGVYHTGTERELIAPFDARFRGHTDGETVDGELLELKSINQKGFEQVLSRGEPKREHTAQCQIYMHYGNYNAALIVYVNRESFEHTAFCLPYDDRLAEGLEQKAKRVLAAIDSKTPPRCECGWCK